MKMSKQEFIEQYDRLGHMWPKLLEGSGAKGVAGVFYEACRNFEISVVRSAVTEILQTETYTPKPVTLVAVCNRIASDRRQRGETTEPQAEQIVSQVLQTEGLNSGNYKITAIDPRGNRIFWYAKEQFKA